MERITEIVYSTRRTGNTTWILKAAIRNPECIIVSKNMMQVQYLADEYHRLLSKSIWYKKLYWKWFGRKHPRFMTINSRFEGMNLPVIFDNETFC